MATVLKQCRNFLKTTFCQYPRQWKSCCTRKYAEIDVFMHNHQLIKYSHWQYISRCTNKSWGTGRKNEFGSKKCGQLLPGDLVSCKALNVVCDANENVNWVFKTLVMPGMLLHHLQLKVASPLILLVFKPSMA